MQELLDVVKHVKPHALIGLAGAGPAVDKPIIEDNRDGTVCVRYEPREEGTHELAVKYNGEHVQGELH